MCTVWEQGSCVGDVDTQGVHCMGAGIMCGDVDTQGVHCMGAGIMCGDVDTQGVHCMGAGIMCGGCGHTRCALFGSRDYVWGMWTQGILC